MTTSLQQALLDWNPWLTGEFPTELLGVVRDYPLLDFLVVPEIKIIEGARRVGKSTLLYQMIHQVLAQGKRCLYVNFEDEVLKHYPLADIVYAHLAHFAVDCLFVDEIQNCLDWVQFIRKMYDRRELQQIWVSGSNSALIKQEYATLLTGRNLAIAIQPLSFHEFLRFKSLPITALPVAKATEAQLYGLFDEFMQYGAFPAVVNRSVLKKELLLAYFDDFIYKDIVSRYAVNPHKVKELAIYLATNSSKLFSYRSMAAALNCHVNTVTDYLTYLKQVFLFDELYKFDFSLKKQLSNDKKIYCLDSGIAGAVSFRFSSDQGRLLETIVYRELRRRQCDIYFHKQKYECDFLVKQALQITEAIQVCYSLVDTATQQREIQGLLEAMHLHGLERGMILTYAETDERTLTVNTRQVKIYIKPVWEWLLHQK